jgi:hypothetical protein
MIAAVTAAMTTPVRIPLIRGSLGNYLRTTAISWALRQRSAAVNA